MFVRSYLTSDENGQSKMENEWQQVKAKVVVKLTKKEQSQQETVGNMFKVIWALEEVRVKCHSAEQKRMKDEEERLAEDFIALKTRLKKHYDHLESCLRWQLMDPEGYAEEVKKSEELNAAAEKDLMMEEDKASDTHRKFLADQMAYQILLRIKEAEEKEQRDQALAAALDEGKIAATRSNVMLSDRIFTRSIQALTQNAKKTPAPQAKQKTIPAPPKAKQKTIPEGDDHAIPSPPKKLKVANVFAEVRAHSARMCQLEQWHLEQALAGSQSPPEAQDEKANDDNTGSAQDAKTEKKTNDDNKDKKDKKAKKHKKNKKDKKKKKAKKREKTWQTSTTLDEW